MKKRLRDERHKNLAHRRWKREKRARLRKKGRSLRRHHYRVWAADPETIVAPSVFSITQNYEETLTFFNSLVGTVSLGKKVRINLKPVEKITPDAILYLLSRIDYLFSSFPQVRIQGNRPDNLECHELLQRSGYYRKVYAQRVGEYQHDHVLEVLSGKKTETKKAESVRQFAVKHLKKGGLQSARGQEIYATLIECMTNTHNHAYGIDGEEDSGRRWWLIAVYSPLSKNISFAFLDNGVGIPATVRKTLSESLQETLMDFLAAVGLSSDEDFVTSALKGEFRTQTELAWRGKGLPKIYSFQKQNRIENLFVVSQNGFVDCSKDLSLRKSRKFEGTLLTWDFTEGSL